MIPRRTQVNARAHEPKRRAALFATVFAWLCGVLAAVTLVGLVAVMFAVPGGVEVGIEIEADASSESAERVLEPSELVDSVDILAEDASTEPRLSRPRAHLVERASMRFPAARVGNPTRAVATRPPV